MGTVISLNSGESIPIIDFDDVLNIIEDKLGYDIMREVYNCIEEYKEEIREIAEEREELGKANDEVLEDTDRMYKVLKEEGDSIEEVIYYYLDENNNKEAYTKLKEARKNMSEVIDCCHYIYG